MKRRVGEVAHRDHRDQRGILEQRHPGRGQGGQHAPEGLRKQNDAEHLGRRHAERHSGVALTGSDRAEPGPEGLRIVSADVEDKTQQCGADRVQSESQCHRHHVERPVDLQNERRRAEEFHIGRADQSDRAPPRVPQDSNGQPQRQCHQHRRGSQADGDGGALKKRSAMFPDHRPVKAHDAPLWASRP